MQKLLIKQTLNTPEINFSPDENIFLICGTSSPEDVRAMYYPVIEWTRIFVDDLLEEEHIPFKNGIPLNLQIDLAYFNSSSAKFLFDIIMEFQRLIKAEIPVTVSWHFDEEDLDMREAGVDISQLVDMQFNFIPKPRKN